MENSHVIGVYFLGTESPLSGMVISQEAGCVYLGIVKAFGDDLVKNLAVVDVSVEWPKGQNYVSVEESVSKINNFVNRYGTNVAEWRTAIEEVLEKRDLMLENCCSIESLTILDFRLCIWMDETEGIMLHSGNCYLVFNNAERAVDLTDITAEKLAHIICQQYGAE
ncbi:TPA: hypothetical protein DD449_04960 [Candidatus Berkelbacteria bacterium]|uniref:Uncharacterized protein n=1 Tax=Berkelbacteria bacterium GW2011_GWE1_39_12 TaxID=1618337 RepID=A0A0G4B5W7_9BACT|nr:MAG: hypothetical protein UT28_C0001G0611 [Berkelbacteria bacterium GW2011_GWE1_39_12]HBO61003.1 hypothetical protein [Candidatus Berkelbacteria bacterium]